MKFNSSGKFQATFSNQTQQKAEMSTDIWGKNNKTIQLQFHIHFYKLDTS